MKVTSKQKQKENVVPGGNKIGVDLTEPSLLNFLLKVEFLFFIRKFRYSL
jgi:hypothetical protein